MQIKIKIPIQNPCLLNYAFGIQADTHPAQWWGISVTTIYVYIVEYICIPGNNYRPLRDNQRRQACYWKIIRRTLQLHRLDKWRVSLTYLPFICFNFQLRYHFTQFILGRVTSSSECCYHHFRILVYYCINITDLGISKIRIMSKPTEEAGQLNK